MAKLNEAQERFINKWEKQREAGLYKYSLIQGLGYGFLLFVFMNFIDDRGRTFNELYFSQEALINLAIFLGGGILMYGPAMWFLNERRYKKYKGL